MKPHDDQRYIEALRNGDTMLIKEIYSQHAASVSQWIKKNNGSASDAKDIFQEAILSLYNKAADKNFKLTCPLGALVFTICKNKWLDQLRKKGRVDKVRKEVEQRLYNNDSALEPLIEQIEEAEIRESKLSNAFSQLSELCQQLLTLIANGISPDEVALQLGMTNTNTVYRRKSACVERWRSLFHTEKSAI